MSTLEDLQWELFLARKDAERCREERDEAQVEAAKLGEANNELCDDMAAAGERIRALEAALEWFADEGHYTETYRPGAGYADVFGTTKARAALLGMDEDDGDAVDEAWRKKEGQAA